MRLTVDLRTIMRILNVAEKNDAAKNIAAQLSQGNSRMVRDIYFFILVYLLIKELYLEKSGKFTVSSRLISQKDKTK